MNPKVTIGMISYNDKKYLEQNLPALLMQDYGDYEILVCNNAPDNGISEWIKTEFPEVKVLSAGGNVGFGAAHNMMMKKADDNGSKYYLCFNSDMLVGPDYVSKLVATAEKDDQTAVTIGKLISWSNFPNDPNEIKEPIIDTVGLYPCSDMRVVDRGQAEVDKGQYDQKEEVFGASGASPLYLMKALKDVQHKEGEFFDNLYFMYKEDVDLAYRLRWAGWKTMYTPKAVAWHDRTATKKKGISARIKERINRPEYVERNSFINQLFVFKKNWSSDFSLMTKIRAFLFILKYFIYVIIFRPKLLSELKKYKRLRKELEQKAQSMPRRISGQEMEKWLGRS